MTSSTEDPPSGEAASEASANIRARAEAERLQEQVLPRGRVVLSCSAPLGVGGLGRHAKEMIDALDRLGQPNVCICETADEADSHSRGRRLSTRAVDLALMPLTRFSPAWRLLKVSTRFDRQAARRLPAADHLIAFNGTARAQFGVAERVGLQSRSLVSATAHVRRLVDRQAQAHRQYPLEPPWASRVSGRNLAEYALADRIYVSSRYAWESFVQEGVDEHLLSLFPLTADPRYAPAASPAQADTFDLVYVGGLTVDKGVPLLLDAVRRLPFADLRVVLVGGWKTRGMRRFVQGACAEDSRITVAAGDPLAHLRRARLYVHPAYCDGFAYSAAEALACGIPVLASEDTGMKDLIDPGRTGLVLPTGDLESLTQTIEAVYRGEVLPR
jgi:glycosyltransferase involved in cell wall biosynthesis